MNATTHGEMHPQTERVQMRPKTMPPQGSNDEVQMRTKSDGLAYSVSMYRNHRCVNVLSQFCTCVNTTENGTQSLLDWLYSYNHPVISYSYASYTCTFSLKFSGRNAQIIKMAGTKWERWPLSIHTM